MFREMVGAQVIAPPAADRGTGRLRVSASVMRGFGLRAGHPVWVRVCDPAPGTSPRGQQGGAVLALCRAWPWQAQYSSTRRVSADLCVTVTATAIDADGIEAPLMLRTVAEAPVPCGEAVVRKNSTQARRPAEMLRSVMLWRLIVPGCRVSCAEEVREGFTVVSCQGERGEQCGTFLVTPRTTVRVVAEEAEDQSRAIAETVQRDEMEQDLSGTQERVGGLSRQLELLKEAVSGPLVHGEVMKHLGAEWGRGILLKGEPGVGKGMLVRAVARECGASLFVVNGPEVVGSRVGESEAALRSLFKRALHRAAEDSGKPVVVFLDELDSLCPARGVEGAQVEQQVEGRIVSQVVSLFDRLHRAKHRVVVIAATNRPNAIDPALRRPGRFDCEVLVPVPDQASREDILRTCATGMPLAEDVDFVETSKKCVGHVGADLAALCREAAMSAAIQKREQVCQADFDVGVRKVAPSTSRDTRVSGIGGVTWDDIGGLAETKRELREAIELPLRHGDSLERFGVKPWKGVLMYGPPGCAKTTLVRAAANSCCASFMTVSGASLFSPYVGDAESAVRELFHRARNSAPSIVFLDEVETIAGKRSGGAGGGGDAARERVLSALLNEMDGVERIRGVVVVGATNREDMIDPALLRPGRFDRRIAVGFPDEIARADVLRIHCRKIPLGSSVDLLWAAKQTMGYSGADLACLCREAALVCLRKNVRIASPSVSPCRFVRLSNATPNRSPVVEWRRNTLRRP